MTRRFLTWTYRFSLRGDTVAGSVIMRRITPCAGYLGHLFRKIKNEQTSA